MKNSLNHYRERSPKYPACPPPPLNQEKWTRMKTNFLQGFIMENLTFFLSILKLLEHFAQLINIIINCPVLSYIVCNSCRIFIFSRLEAFQNKFLSFFLIKVNACRLDTKVMKIKTSSKK